MDVDYARLANAISLPEAIQNVPKAVKPPVVSNAAQAYTSPPPEEVNNLINFRNLIYFSVSFF